MGKILLLEDDTNLNNGIQLCLTREGYEVAACFDIATAEQAFQKNEIDLVISDLSLPDGSGLEFCQTIREQSNVLILMLTSYNQEHDIVSGYVHGADDYMTKPFSLMVLVSKVQALMKRVVRNQGQELVSGELSVSLTEMRVKLHDKVLPLSKTEIQLLILFMENPKQILSADQLLDQIWDTKGDFVDTNTVSVNISRLRQKIGKERIKTVRGVGYLWINDVQKK
ncbi:hypothetical protein IGI39_002443 [Enterococcus sp. AZ135]|uniref:response regulator transcription factor n=1 Tax=unclassified Enterococcus TaxID=2608891 RepID=UPI003F28D412